jgi:hypothetical protein
MSQSGCSTSPTPCQKSSRRNKKNKLSNDAKTNVLCDLLATKYLNKMRDSELAPQSTPLFPVTTNLVLMIQGKTILNHYTRQLLRERIGDDQHQEYIRNKFKWDVHAYGHINWEALKKFLKSLLLQQLANASKLAHNWLPLGQLLEQDAAAKLIASKCPCCLKAVESFAHML